MDISGSLLVAIMFVVLLSIGIGNSGWSNVGIGNSGTGSIGIDLDCDNCIGIGD